MDARLARIVADIETNLPLWLPGAPVHGPVAITGDLRRRSSRIIRLTVGDPTQYRIFVKATPDAGRSATSFGNRPRLVPVTDVARLVLTERVAHAFALAVTAQIE